MIRTLMRLDASRQDLLKHVLIGLGLVALLQLIQTMDTEYPPLFSRGTPGGGRALQGFMLWVLVIMSLTSGKFWIRAPQLLLGLPLLGRDVVRARLTVQALRGLVQLVPAFLVASIRWQSGGGLTLETATWDAFPMFCALHVIMLLLPSSIEPVLRCLKMDVPMIALVGLMWVVAGVVVVAMPWHPAGGIALLALSLLGLVAVIRRVPDNLELELQEPARVAAAPVADTVPSGRTTTAPSAPTDRTFTAVPPARPNRGLLLLTLIRMLHHHWLGWIFPAALAIYGPLLVNNHRDGDDSLFYGTYVIFFVIGLLVQGLKRLHLADAWPVSRRTVYWLTLLPGLTCFLLGMGLAMFTTADKTTVTNRPFNVDVPHEFKGLTLDGVVPPTVAPWGEEHTPEGFPVVPGLPWRVYRPYEYGKDNSPRFQDWLTDRALADVYGEAVAALPHSGSAVQDTAYARKMQNKVFHLREPLGLPTSVYSRAYAAEVMLMALVGAGLGLLMLQGFDPRWTTPRKKRVAKLATIIPMVVAGLLVLAQLARWSATWVAPAAAMIGIRQAADAVGGSPRAWWLAVGVTVTAVLLLVQERFVRLEANRDGCLKGCTEDF